MNRQATLMRNLETGRIEMTRANQPYNYDEDMSEGSEEKENENGGTSVTYLTTNMLAPAMQPINEINVDTLDEDQIKRHLHQYYSVSLHHRAHFSIFDPKERLLPYKNKQLPPSLLSAAQVRSSAVDGKELYIQLRSNQQQHSNVVMEEEKKSPDSSLIEDQSELITQQQQPDEGALDLNTKWLPKRELKRRNKIQMAQASELFKLNKARQQYTMDGLTIKQIAKFHKKSICWVRKALNRHKKNRWAAFRGSVRPIKFQKIHARARAIIDQYVKDCKGPLHIPDVVEALKKKHKIKLGRSLVRDYFREELGMRYRVLGVVGQRFDEPPTLLKRQVAAQEYIKVLKAGHEVFNIDESIIRSTDQRRRGWAQAKNRILVSKALRLPQISVIAAVSSQGRVYFTINQGKTTSLTFLLFLSKLSAQLDQQDRHWRVKSKFLIDNASFHRSEKAQEGYQKMGLPIMFLGPYSFNMAAVEKFFSFIKNRDLNPLATRAFSRDYTRTYIKELALHLCRLDFSWVRKAFSHTLVASLNALSLKRECNNQ